MDLTASDDAVILAQTAPSTSALSLRRVAIDTYRENVAYLHRDCAIYRAEGFQALSKIEVRANGRRILASLNVVDDHSIVGCHELGLSEDAFLQLDVQDGHTASVAQVSIAWLLARPWVSTVIVGANNLRQMEDNLGAISISLTSTDLACLDEVAMRPAPYPQWMQGMGADAQIKLACP